MTSIVLTPWWRHRRPASARAGEAPGSAVPTAILDWRHERVQELLADARSAAAGTGERPLLLAAHRLISDRVRAVYALDDAQCASRTLARRRGSCSQRLAVLEAVARAAGIPTRVRGLLVDGSFWYPRFPRLRPLVPDTVVLAWPEFRLGQEWVGVSELYAPLGALGEANPAGFTNTGSQTLFEALASTAVDWDGSTCGADGCSSFDLSAVVRRDLGRFSSRDELFAAHGQTLCRPARIAAGALLGRRSAA
ncbi:transglutaminase-like domain-containing protein [Streptomyces flavidovirens]|uniref:transglutaminase-like domain-containing protein n=1 Tax=Streptomyces flavidovirens TaxID=67298 RepID=UPI00048CDE45|nr:transglutaminase family protein [Streptomyces flavidovirens]